jgi:hypothetical protein
MVLSFGADEEFTTAGLDPRLRWLTVGVPEANKRQPASET